LAEERARQIPCDAPALDREPTGPFGGAPARGLDRRLELRDPRTAALRPCELGRELPATADQVLDRPGVFPAQAGELCEAFLDRLQARGIGREAADVAAELGARLLQLRERRVEERADRIEARVETDRLSQRAERAPDRLDRGALARVDRALGTGCERGEPLRVYEAAALRREPFLLAGNERGALEL